MGTIFIVLISLSGTPQFAEDWFIVKLKESPKMEIKENTLHTGFPSVDSLCHLYGIVRTEAVFKTTPKNRIKVRNMGLDRVFRLYLNTPNSIISAIKDFGNDHYVEYAEPDFLGEMDNYLFPNDSCFSRQWWAYNDGTFNSKATEDADIDLAEAWDITTGSNEIVLAILDTGVKLNHPEIAPRLWVNQDEVPDNGIDDDENGYVDDTYGWDIVNQDNDPSDDRGHGAWVAGIAAATGNNGIDYAGMNWHCKIMVLKEIDWEGYGNVSWWAEALQYAVDNGAEVINMSQGIEDSSSTLYSGVLYAYDAGCVIVASMGNRDKEELHYPATYSETIAVGATDVDDTRATFSNYGDWIDVVAPGKDICGLSYKNNTTCDTCWSGTSASAPMVAGLVCLMLARNPTLTPEEIKAIIRETAEDQVGDPSEDKHGFDKYFGYGRINAYDALKEVIGIEEKLPSLPFPLKIFPDPFSSSFTISNLPPSRWELKIFDITGRKVKRISLQQGECSSLEITTKDLPKGVYFLCISSNRWNFFKKVLLR